MNVGGRPVGGLGRSRARAGRGKRGEKVRRAKAKRSETPEDPDDILEVYHENIGGNADANECTRRETKSGLEWNGTDGMVYD